MAANNADVTIGDSIDMSKQNDVVLEEHLARNEYPGFTEDNKSSTAKIMNKALFDELKDLKTPKGFTIARAINTGVKNPKSLTGCHAGDVESYDVFAKFFDQVISSYHNGYAPDAKHPTDVDPNNLKGEIGHRDDIISTRIRVARNLSGFSLAPGMTSVDEKLAVESLMKKVFEDLQGDEELAGEYFSLDGMSEEKRMELVRDHFLFKGNDQMQADSGYHRWWPKGRGIYINKAKTFLMWINEGDHIRIISMEKGGDVNSVFKRLAHASAMIEKYCKKNGCEGFQRTDHLGMVTCCPTNLGTGLRGSVLIKLPPSLAEKGEAWLKEEMGKVGLQVRGLYGEHSQTKDAIYDISNQYRLGYSEVQLVQMMIDGINKLNTMK